VEINIAALHVHGTTHFWK